jgi:phospholipid/cholesterol/gamma-HCH transport system substrate-binding protein
MITGLRLEPAFMRFKVLRICAVVAIAAIALLILVVGRWPIGHRLTVKAYFANVDGLREGAPVRIAGVNIGTVKTVQVRPELGQEPVEVVMMLNPPYEIRIPSDSTVSIATAGVFGETYAEINSASASGPPIGPNAVLKAQRTEQMTMQQLLESVTRILEKKNCGCGVQNEKAEHAPQPAQHSTISR